MPCFPGTAVAPPLSRPTLQQRLKSQHPLVEEPPEARPEEEGDATPAETDAP
ncbi:hypothetical protein QZH56_25820 [Streptomyces olivoreticuli]|uniref:Uncharacterized protein n=1 Tax=Streptomyces blastmyceticus TaxID=68180 RepID=A0ABP3H210_9ACTN|nr:hypothetical protein [Streptomyces olivoreticuli]WKK22194.1 hypothetical protein QZH56_25820 [Streptomyces olivoreticuli]